MSTAKTTWKKAIATFLAPIVLVLMVRWIFFEPYVIPSGSMIPTLLVHDHILVNKWAYGFRWPFTKSWLGFWRHPQPGEIAVFRYPRSPDTFYVKRVVAIAGDTIEVRQGQLIRNGKPVARKLIANPLSSTLNPTGVGDTFKYYQENLEGHILLSRSLESQLSGEGVLESKLIKVPEGHFFVVGDNRDESFDSRIWGFVPESLLMGRAGLIWLSCENTLPAAPFICDPNSIRWNRIFKKVQ